MEASIELEIDMKNEVKKCMSLRYNGDLSQAKFLEHANTKINLMYSLVILVKYS